MKRKTLRKPPVKLTGGAGGGLGRLQKARAQAKKNKR